MGKASQDGKRAGESALNWILIRNDFYVSPCDETEKRQRNEGEKERKPLNYSWAIAAVSYHRIYRRRAKILREERKTGIEIKEGKSRFEYLTRLSCSSRALLTLIFECIFMANFVNARICESSFKYTVNVFSLVHDDCDYGNSKRNVSLFFVVEDQERGAWRPRASNFATDKFHRFRSFNSRRELYEFRIEFMKAHRGTGKFE